MAIATTAVHTEVQRHATDLSDQTEFLRYLNYTHDDLCAEIRLYAETDEDISLTAGTREYTLDPNVLRIWDATYFASATQFWTLEPTTPDELDYEQKGWRNMSSGRVNLFYESGGKVGFHQTPATTTSTYPLVRLKTAQRVVLDASASLPGQIRSIDAWVYGILRRFYTAVDRKQFELFAHLERVAKQHLATAIMGINVRVKPHASQDIPDVVNI